VERGRGREYEKERKSEGGREKVKPKSKFLIFSPLHCKHFFGNDRLDEPLDALAVMQCLRLPYLDI